MGKILLFSFFILLASFGSAQISNRIPHDLNQFSYEELNKYLAEVQQFNNDSTDLYLPVQALINDITRYTYSYNSSGKIILLLQEYYLNGSWNQNRRETYAYNTSGYIQTLFAEQMTDSVWSPSYRYTYTYDNAGHLITHLVEIYVGGEIGAFLRYMMTYDNSGNITETLIQSFNSGIWQNEFRFKYTYGTDILTMVYQDWNEGNWENKNRSTYNYAGQLIVNFLYEKWISDWVNDYRQTYTYVNSGLKTMLRENWINDAWVGYLSRTYFYNDDGLLVKRHDQKYENNFWINDYRVTYTYNSSGKLLSETTEDWISSNWINEFNRIYDYDINGNAFRGEHFVWNQNWVPGDGLLKMFYNNNNDTLLCSGSWVDVQYDIFTDISEPQAPELSYFLDNNYPNPFNPATSIRYSLAEESRVKLNVYNALGELIVQLKNDIQSGGTYEAAFNAETLPSGIYFYSIYAETVTGNKVFTAARKMILLK